MSPEKSIKKRFQLEGKVALVTGAARGTGEQTARLFASEGARVVVADVQEEAGSKVAAELDCRLLEAGHFYFRVEAAPGAYVLRDVNRKIQSLGYDVIRNRRTITRTELGPNGVHREVIEAVEGDGYRYADPQCRYRRGR